MNSDFELIVAAIQVACGDPTLPFSPFRLAQKLHGPQRRVLFFPLNFRTRAPTETGPRTSPDGAIFYDVMFRETWVVECLIVGDTWRDAEAIRRRVTAVAKGLMGTSCRVLDGNWLTQQGDEARLTYGGAEQIAVRFEWDLDVFSGPIVPELVPAFEPGTIPSTGIDSIVTTAEQGEPEVPPAPIVITQLDEPE